MISNNDFENCRIFLLKELNIKNTGVELLPGNYVKATIKFASQQSYELTVENDLLKEKCKLLELQMTTKQSEKQLRDLLEDTDEKIYEIASNNNHSPWRGHSHGYYFHFIEGAEWLRNELLNKLK